MKLPMLDEIETCLTRLSASLLVVDHENVPVATCGGRVLAEPLNADRDSPPLDVSAMDGFAVNLTDLSLGVLPVSATCAAGSAPLALEKGTAIRIFTGAPIPASANCVIKREDAQLNENLVSFRGDTFEVGQNIRYQGSNGRMGETILPTGSLLTGSAMASVASFGASNLVVHRKLRVGIINTGDELVPPGQPAQPWQIRDSNGPTLAAMLTSQTWIELAFRVQVKDQFERVLAEIRDQLPKVDAILMTGGVSMGDCDFVPQAIEAAGCRIVFHRLPIRPGRPVLGAVTNDGKLIMGLPGNPVSVAVTARRLAWPMLRYAAGFAKWEDRPLSCLLANADDRCLDMVWYRLVAIHSSGKVQLIDSQGSGDIVSLAKGDGFIEVPPNACGEGPWRLWTWPT